MKLIRDISAFYDWRHYYLYLCSHRPLQSMVFVNCRQDLWPDR